MQAKTDQPQTQPVDALAEVREYCMDVSTGAVPAGSALQLACTRSLREIEEPAGVYWCRDELQRVVDFCHRLTLYNYMGRPCTLFPWQMHLMGCLLARRRQADAEHATRRLVLEIGKGNAKSTTAAMLALYLLAETPYHVEVQAIATKRDQAHRIVDTCGMLAKASGLAEKGGPIVVRHLKIRSAEHGSFFESQATKERTADGLNARLYIADECGRYTDDTLGKMTIAEAKPSAPTVLMLTTPGQNRANSYYKIRDEMEQALREGKLRDHHVALLYGLDEDDDAFDPKTWPKANPMLLAGVIKSEDIAHLADDARLSTKDRAEFTREICCRFDDRDAAFIDMDLWDACQRDFDPLEIAKGRRVVAAADLSKSHDLTAVMLAVVDERGDVYSWGHAWTCEHELEVRERAGNAPYSDWARLGHLTICPGATIDLGSVRAYLDKWASAVDLWKIYVDPVSGSADTLEQWRREGLPIEGHSQTRMHLSPPLQKLYTLIRNAHKPEEPHLWHLGDPMLRQCVRNTRVTFDWAGNPTAEKDKAAGRIDGLIAQVMSLTGCMELARTPISAYESSSAI